MRTFKGLVCTLLAVLVAFSLAACGSKDNGGNAEETKLTFWHVFVEEEKLPISDD